jgi:hypothetical protein
MDPELVQYCNLVTDEEHDWIESSNNNGQKKYNLNILCPAQSERNRKVVLGRAMMRNMRSPPEPAFMAYFMRNIAPEIGPNQT